MEPWLLMVPIYPLYIMYLGWEKLCLLLDYDGTLAPHGSYIYPLYIMYLGWEKLCLLLDYDGTLAPHGSYISTLYNVSRLGEAMFAPGL